MSNLLPQQIQKKNIAEYRLRLSGTVLAMVAAILILVIVLLVPAYVLVSNKKSTILSDSLWQADKDGVTLRAQQMEIENIINETNRVLDVFEPDKDSVVVSEDVIAKIVSFKSEPILINGIFYDAQNVGGSLSIKGTAINRQSLISFTESLKKDSTFSSVDLPISNLVKDRDVPFSITIKLKHDTEAKIAPEVNINPKADE